MIGVSGWGCYVIDVVVGNDLFTVLFGLGIASAATSSDPLKISYQHSTPDTPYNLSSVPGLAPHDKSSSPLSVSAPPHQA